MHENDGIDAFKKYAVMQANKEVNDFVANNSDLLNESVELLCVALKAKEKVIAGKLSYQLSTTAPLFGRSDIANMTDFLTKILKNPDFTDFDAIYELFRGNFMALSALDVPDSELDQKILVKTRNFLAQLRS